MGGSNLVTDPSHSSESFSEYFKRSRLLKIALAFNLIYYFGVIASFAFLLFQGTVFDTVFTVDFRVFYEAGQAFANSPGEIYTVNPHGLPFRYFPTFAAFMALFSSIPLVQLYLIDISFMMVCNFGIVYFVYQICIQLGVSSTTKNFEKTLTFVFIAPQHIVNIMFGQITQLSILLTIIALFILRTKELDKIQWFFVVGLLIGLATTIKPFFVVFIPFMIPISRGGRLGITISLRHLVGVSIGILCVMVPNLIFFILYPNAVNEFIQINFVQDLTGQHSTSLTKLILAFVNLADTFLIQLGIIIIIGGFIFFKSYFHFIQSPENQKQYQRHFTDMVFLILLVYPDSWFLFIAVWYAFLAPSMLLLYNSSSISEDEMKKLDILWSGSNNLLAFFSIGIVLHYLVLGFDPIIPIWLLILYVLYQRAMTRVEIRKKSKNITPTSL